MVPLCIFTSIVVINPLPDNQTAFNTVTSATLDFMLSLEW